MTNVRQRRLIFEPITARNPDTVLINRRFLLVKPIRHVVRRVLLPTTYLAAFTNLEWDAVEAFPADLDLVRRMGRYGLPLVRDQTVTDPSSRRDWEWSDPTMVADLMATIEAEALPFLRGLDPLERYAAWYRHYYRETTRERQEDRLVMDIALGDLDAARATYRAVSPRYREDWNDPYYRIDRARIVAVAQPLMDGDREALAALLHGWEAANIRGTVLEPHWEPTPFPLESRADPA